MFILKSSSAAHGFIDIARCTIGNPHLVDVIEANAPFARRNRRVLERHVERVLGAAEVIAAACHAPPRKGMPVPIDVRDAAIHAALVAMLDLYLQFIELGDTAGYCADAIDVAEIRMTIQAALDLPELQALRLEGAQGGRDVASGTSSGASCPTAAGSSTSSSSLIPTSV
jgi:hypothetical protein